MIKNGRPYSVSRNGDIDAALITARKPEEQKVVLRWIKANICPRKTPNLLHTSYSLKHLLERDIGIYLTNNEFKDAMMLCGFEPANPNELNWTFGISQKSPIFKKKQQHKGELKMSNVCERAPKGYDVDSCIYQKKNCRMQCLRESQVRKDQELIDRNDLLYGLSHFLLQESPIDETDKERKLIADTIKECMRVIEEAPAVRRPKAKRNKK